MALVNAILAVAFALALALSYQTQEAEHERWDEIERSLPSASGGTSIEVLNLRTWVGPESHAGTLKDRLASRRAYTRNGKLYDGWTYREIRIIQSNRPSSARFPNQYTKAMNEEVKQVKALEDQGFMVILVVRRT